MHSADYGGGPMERRPQTQGDPRNWICHMCNTENFSTRTHCGRKDCGCPRPIDDMGMRHMQQPMMHPMMSMHPHMQQMPQMQPMSQMPQMPPPVVQDGNWLCSLCNTPNYPQNMLCSNKNCSVPRPGFQMPQMRPPPMQQHVPVGYASPYGYGAPPNGPTSQQTMPPPGMQQMPMMQPSFMPYMTNPMKPPGPGMMSPYMQPQMPMMMPGMPYMSPYGGRPSDSRPTRAGDWTCPACNNHNFYFRDVCNTEGCDTRRVDCLRWICADCSTDNAPENAVCVMHTCQKPKPDEPQLVYERENSGGNSGDQTDVYGRKRSMPGDPGNWFCDACGNENFPSRTFCNIPTCRKSRADVPGGSAKRQRTS